MKKTIFITSIAIIALSIQMLDLQDVSSAVLLDRVVATVNDEVITWSELMNVIAFEGKEYLNKGNEKERQEKIKELERPFLNSLIDMKLQIQEARKLGLDVEDSEVEGAINDIKKKFNLTDEAFINSLQSERLALGDYRKKLSNQILLQKVVNFAVKGNIVISEKDIEEYYETNKEKYGEKEKLKIRQIFFAAPEDDSQKTAIEAKAQDMIQRIQRGEDFAKLASEFSEDASGQFGGDLGYITRGSALREIEEAAFALKIGEVSRPFWSPTGLHIIKLEDKIEGGGIERIRDRIKEALFQKAFELKYHEWKAGLREKAYVEIKL